jgi:hypothetical protein
MVTAVAEVRIRWVSTSRMLRGQRFIVATSYLVYCGGSCDNGATAMDVLGISTIGHHSSGRTG